MFTSTGRPGSWARSTAGRPRNARVARVDADEARELFETRRALDPEAIALACKRRTDADIARMQEALTHLLPVTRQWGEAALIAHREVHQAIYVASHNTVLVRLLDDLWDKSDRYRPGRTRLASSRL